MVHLYSTFRQAVAVITTLFYQPDWRNFLDIALVSIIVYYVLRLVMRTRANSVIKGIGLIVVLAWVANLLEINALSWLLKQLVNSWLLVVVVLFQPELRRGLEQIGRSKLARKILISNRNRKMDFTDEQIAEIVKAALNMSRKRIGALIVFERQTALGDVIESGTSVDADISAPLIENIFEPKTPLHDGAMIISDGRITAAACLLQLSSDYSISRELGTRHRAAIGITESTDAVSLVVSEETGIISIAQEGRLIRFLDAERLTGILRELFTDVKSQNNYLHGILKRTTKKAEGGNEKKN